MKTITSTQRASILQQGKLLYYKLTKPTPGFRTPERNAPVLYLKNDTNIRNVDDIRRLNFGNVNAVNGRTTIWNLEGGILDGKNQRGDGSQKENQEPLFTAFLNNLVVKNGFVSNNKEAISAKGKNITFRRLTFLNVGEDAISTSDQHGDGLSVVDCQFVNWGGDKTVQVNRTKNVLIQGNLFIGGITSVSLGDVVSEPNTATVLGNKHIGVETPYHCSGEGLFTIHENTQTYDGTKFLYVLVDGAKVALV